MTNTLLKRALRSAWEHPRLRRLGRWTFRLPLLGRAFRRIAQRILPPGERVWVRIASGPAQGLWMRLDPYREVQYLEGCPEPRLQEQLLKHLKQGDVFYDIGAHIGFYSLVGARLVGSTGSVVAFEPDPSNARLLQENLIKNGLSQVQMVCAAVWSSKGCVPFQKSGSRNLPTSTRQGCVALLNPPQDPSNLLTVKAVALDQFVRNESAPGVVKIDVEGAEVEVLKGAQRLLIEARPVLLCEVHGPQGAAFIEYELGCLGYRLEWLPQDPRYAQYSFPRHVVACPARSNPNS